MDIIILAAIAIFIFFKLRNELGKVDEDQKRDAIKNFIKEQARNNNSKPTIIAIPGNFAEQNNPIDPKSQKILDQLDEETRQDFIMVLERAQTSAADFMNGATQAFEMIIEDFASGNLENLKPLLSDKIFAGFEQAINKRKSTGEILVTKILSISESKVTAAKMLQNHALITIRFASTQINYLTNNAGEITSGSKEEVNKIVDIWTFRKDCQSPNPNWIVFATANQ